MGFIDVALQMGTLVIPIVFGFVAHKLGYLDEKLDGRITTLVLDIALPCMIIASVSSVSTPLGLTTILQLLGFSTLGYLLVLVLALIVPRLMGAPAETRGVYSFMVMFGNVGFIGFPVISTIYGSEAVVYAAIANIPWHILVFSLGVVLVRGQADSPRELAVSCAKRLRTPVVLACFVLLALVLAGVTGLGVLGDGLEVVGDLTTPAALLVTGSTIARYRPHEMLSNWRAYVVSACRLVAVPALLWLIVGPLISSDLVRGVIIVGQAMPMATNGTLFCLQYNVDAKPMLQGTFISIIASAVTIPFVVMLAGL